MYACRVLCPNGERRHRSSRLDQSASVIRSVLQLHFQQARLLAPIVEVGEMQHAGFSGVKDKAESSRLAFHSRQIAQVNSPFVWAPGEVQIVSQLPLRS